MVVLKLNMLVGTLIGFTIGFLLYSIWTDDINWTLWIAILIGGIAGHFIMVNINERKKITVEKRQ